MTDRSDQQAISGAASLIRALEHAGVDTVFGIPGGAILPAYDPMLDSTQIRHILVRHEQGAGHAAQGYAAASGKVGVCMATSGPGATNLVTPIADAYMDSVPIVAVTGQVPSAAIGTDAFQEADIRGITMPITKHNFLVTDPAEIPRTLAEAFHIAPTGRPGRERADLIISLGARFDDRVTGKLSSFAPEAKIVHADIDPAEISKNRVADVPIVGDCREVIGDLVVAVRSEHDAGHRGDYEAWWAQV